MSGRKKYALVLLLGVASTALIIGMTAGAKLAEASNLEVVDPYNAGGWYEVTGNDSHLVRYNPRTGASWVLACPGAVKDCVWDPIEVRDAGD